MGEKEIVEGGPGATVGGGTTGGTTTGGGFVDPMPPGGAGGGTPHAPGPGQTPQTQERKDPCKELTDKAQDLLKQLEALHTQNRDAMQRALRAFFGDKKNPNYDGYAHWFSQAKVTEAVVDAETATGKALIDVALFAAGGWGGIAGEGSIAEGLLGKGIQGAKSVGDAWSKVGIKILSKAGDSMIGDKAGTMGAAGYKFYQGASAGDVDKAMQGPVGALESVVRGQIIDALGNWMKEGATSADLERAKAQYADFCAAAAIANSTAAAAEDIDKQLHDVNAQLRAQGCPEVPIPDYYFYTFDILQFGQGMFEGEQGPTMHRKAIESGNTLPDVDLFSKTADPSDLPF